MEIKIEDLLFEIAKFKKEIEKLKIENEQLKRENAWLRAQLNMNSSNSSLPSSDKFGKKKIKTDLLERRVLNLLVDKRDIKVLLLINLIILILL